MAQFSVKIMRLTGSLLGENQHCLRYGMVSAACLLHQVTPYLHDPEPAKALAGVRR